MFSYLLSRWRLSRSFEVCNGDYLYRRRPTAEAIRVTEEERAQIMRSFRAAYWKYHAILWVGIIALISAAVGLTVLLNAPDEVGTSFGYGVALLIVAALIYIDRRLLTIATASLSPRPPLKPRRSWLQVVDTRLATTSWWRLVGGGALLALLAWLTQSIATDYVWGGIGWVCYFGLCFGFWARNVWRKWQIQERT